MITTQELARAFAINTDYAKTQCKGLTHADSVLQPPAPGNCLNWVLGHMLDSRNTVLAQLGKPAFLSEAHAKRYGYGSEPVCADGGDILRFDRILALLDESQAALERALASASEEQLKKPVQSFLGQTPLAFLVFYLFRHETYHLGQTELLRELALASHKGG